MSKKKIFVMSVLLMVVTCAAAARPFAELSSSRDDEVVIEIEYENESEESEGPRMPVRIPISGVIDNGLNAAVLSFAYNCGTVSVEMVNTEDGTTLDEEVDGVGTVMIPFNFTTGYWTVTFTLENGAVYHGYSEIAESMD